MADWVILTHCVPFSFSKVKCLKTFKTKQKRLRKLISYKILKLPRAIKPEKKEPLAKPIQWMKKWKYRKVHPLSDSR